jgi:hypothetical protein
MYDSAEYELNCPSKDELKEQLIIVGYRVDASHPDLDHPATIGKLLLACEELVQARGQTIEMFCGMFRTWQGRCGAQGRGESRSRSGATSRGSDSSHAARSPRGCTYTSRRRFRR